MNTLPPITNNPDVRYLGRVLGDVIRAYGGQKLYERTETIRSASVERHRGNDDAAPDAELGTLDLDETLDFVRGFMLFSMLANLAEDRQGIQAEQGADVAAALERLADAGVDRDAVLALLDHALIAPVLTAHPTEVRRKSMIDHRNRIAQLMAMRDRGAETTPDGDRVDEAIVRQVALLWQTRVLRRERLYVVDEVETALSYLRDVFLPVVPALYQKWDRALGTRVPAFLKPGSWIGGDRDGNPFVTADSLRTALAKAAQAAIGKLIGDDAQIAKGRDEQAAAGKDGAVMGHDAVLPSHPLVGVVGQLHGKDAPAGRGVNADQLRLVVHREHGPARDQHGAVGAVLVAPFRQAGGEVVDGRDRAVGAGDEVGLAGMVEGDRIAALVVELHGRAEGGHGRLDDLADAVLHQVQAAGPHDDGGPVHELHAAHAGDLEGPHRMAVLEPVDRDRPSRGRPSQTSPASRRRRGRRRSRRRRSRRGRRRAASAAVGCPRCRSRR